MSGWFIAQIRRSTRLSLWAVVISVAMARFAGAQPTAAQQLERALPQWFPEGVLADAAGWGSGAVRIVELGPVLAEQGFEAGDLLLGAEGRALYGMLTTALPDVPVWTVVRQVQGERPVLPLAVLAGQTLDSFSQLEAVARTPMRLARMLANQVTLIEEGAGVLLLPASAGQDDAEWLRVANPLPSRSERAILAAADAYRDRVRLPFIEMSEAEAAVQAIEDGDMLEARERSARALLEFVGASERRAAPGDFEPLLHTYLTATGALAQERLELQRPQPFYGLYVEGRLNNVQAFLPQNTKVNVENSYGATFAGGMRFRIVRRVDFLLGYEHVRNTFEDAAGRPKIETQLHACVGELVFRPAVMTRLRPALRAAGGIYPLSLRLFRDDGELAASVSTLQPGFELGGGVDVFYWRRAKLRVSAVGSFRVLHYSFARRSTAGIGFDQISNLEPLQTPVLKRNRFELDMDGWQAGLMLGIDLDL